MYISDKECFECGAPATYKHHVVPKSKGGKKKILLCSNCHGLVHDIVMVTTSTLIKMGLERARKNGKKLGRTRSIPEPMRELIRQYRREGKSYRQTAKLLGVPMGTIRSVVKTDLRDEMPQKVGQMMEDAIEDFRLRLKKEITAQSLKQTEEVA